MKITKRRVVEKERITQIAMIAPAVRLLVVTADVWQDDDGKIESETFVMPVVAIRETVLEIWTRHESGTESDWPHYANAVEFRKAGYQFHGQQLNQEMLVIDYTGDGIVVLDDLRCMDRALRVVAATWEPSDDERHLAPIVASLVAETTKRLTQQHPHGGRLAS